MDKDLQRLLGLKEDLCQMLSAVEAEIESRYRRQWGLDTWARAYLRTPYGAYSSLGDSLLYNTKGAMSGRISPKFRTSNRSY